MIKENYIRNTIKWMFGPFFHNTLRILFTWTKASY